MRQVLCPVVVGRDAEMDAIARLISAVRADRGGAAAFVVGDAGVGKSRLLREAAALAASHGMVVLRGRAVGGGTATPYRPLAEAVLPALRVSGPPRSPALVPYHAVLGRIVPEWRMTDAPTPESPAILGEGFLRLLGVLAPESGVLLVLEDLHWADPETIDVVEYVIDNVGDQRLLCLASVRPGSSSGLRAASGLAARGSAQFIELARLYGAEAVEMCAHCLGTDVAPAGIEQVVDRTDGLPFMVEELLAAAVEAGSLRRDGTGWVLATGAGISIPHTFAETVGQRFAALVEKDREVLAAAALLGRRFDWTLLPVALRRSDRSVLASLRRAAQAQLTILEADDFRFRHALTCDAILGALVGSERAELVGALLEAITHVHPTCPGSGVSSWPRCTRRRAHPGTRRRAT